MAGVRKATRKALATFVVAEALIVAAVVALRVWVTRDPGPLATLHPAGYAEYYQVHPQLMLAAFCVCGLNAAMLFRVLPAMGHGPVKGVHVLLHTAAVTLAGGGIHRIYRFHASNAIVNWYSVHSVVGLAAFAAYLLQYLIGLAVFAMPNTKPAVRSAVMPFHRWLGATALVGTNVACILGCFDRQRISWEVGPASVSYTNVTDKWANATALLIGFAVVFATLVISAVTKRDKRPEEDDGSGADNVAHTGLGGGSLRARSSGGSGGGEDDGGTPLLGVVSI